VNDELSFEQLVLIMGGHTAFQLLWAASELGVFSLLSDSPGMSKQEIGQKICLESRPLRILLTGLTALRLILKNGDVYSNSAMVEKMLVPGKPGNWVDVLGWQGHIVYPGEMDFVESLRKDTNAGLKHFPGNEPNLYARLSHAPMLEKVFQDAMSSLSSSANTLLAKGVDLNKVCHLVDAGGGDGTNAIRLATEYPHLKVTIFDSPSVCEIAQVNIAKAGLTQRINTHPGNFFERDFPPGIDCILFAHMLTIWSPEKDTALLRRAYEALPEGGQVVIFNMMGLDDETGPMTTALGSPYFLSIATGEGMLYTWKEYETFLAEAGFKQTQRFELPKDHGALIGVK
jgi:L-tyrosine C(3)-methyltransferase